MQQSRDDQSRVLGTSMKESSYFLLVVYTCLISPEVGVQVAADVCADLSHTSQSVQNVYACSCIVKTLASLKRKNKLSLPH